MFNTSISSSALGYTPRRDPAELGDKLFTQLDKNNQGYLEKSDLQAAFARVYATERKNGQGASAEKVFEQMDANSDGKLTRDEMVSGVVAISRQLEEQFNAFRAQGLVGPEGVKPPIHKAQKGAELAQELFTALDPKQRGYFEKSDLQAAFDKLGSSAEKSQRINDMFAAMDADSDGKVNAEEFAKHLQSAGMSRAEAPEFSKDELAAMVQRVGEGNSKRAALINDLIRNFDRIDTDGNGKLSKQEADSFRRANTHGEHLSTRQMAIQAYTASVSTVSQSLKVSS